MKPFICLLAVLLVSNASSADRESPSPERWKGSLGEFFSRVDSNADGQIEPQEAAQYIGDGGVEDQDLQCMQSNVDGADHGDTISEGELQRHLHSLLKGNRVAEWVSHSVGLPQYVKAFRDNSVTVLDFPLFVNDGGASLKDDLKIRSALHRQQLTRAMKRVILGLGTSPSAPRDLQCRQVSCGSILLTWQPPERLGHPPLHKYKLQRSEGDDSLWVTVNKDLDDEESLWEDRGLQEGVYRYRLTAWNAYGWSDEALSSECILSSASHACKACELDGSCNQSAFVHDREGKEHGWLGTHSGRGSTDGEWDLKRTLGTVGAMGAGIALIVYLRRERRRLAGLGKKQGVHPMEGGGADMVEGPSGDRQLPNGVPRSLSGRSYGRSDSGRSQGSDLINRRRVAFTMDGHTDSGLSEQSVEAASESGVMDGSGAPRRLSAHHGSFGELSHGLEEQLHALEPLQINSARQRLAFSNPQPTAFPSHMLNDPNAVNRWVGGAEAGPSSRMVQSVFSSGRQGAGGGGLDMEDHDEDVPETPAGVDPWRCGHFGCHRQFRGYKLSNVKHAMQRHFCSVCQRVFCHHHTAYSPHGPLGSCGMESQCVCEDCFSALPRSTQERLKKTNKLVKKAPKAVHHSHSTGELHGESEGNLHASGSGDGQLARADRTPPNFAALLKSFGSARRSSSAKTDGGPSSSGREAGSDTEPERRESFASGRRQHRSAQQRWSLARSTISAALKFRRAGEERRASQDAQPHPQPQGTS